MARFIMNPVIEVKMAQTITNRHQKFLSESKVGMINIPISVQVWNDKKVWIFIRTIFVFCFENSFLSISPQKCIFAFKLSLLDKTAFIAGASLSKGSTVGKITLKLLKSALDFEFHFILSERTRFSTLRFSLKIKSFAK